MFRSDDEVTIAIVPTEETDQIAARDDSYAGDDDIFNNG